MLGPDPETLTRQVAAFPRPPDEPRFERADALLDGAYAELSASWYPELRRLADEYAAGDLLREDVLAHAESVPRFPLGTAEEPDGGRAAALREATALVEEVRAVAAWYDDLLDLLDPAPSALSLDERLLHGVGYALAHGLFVGARTPERVVRRLRVAYRSVGVRIDEAETDGDTERTTFTCPYRNVAGGRCGERRVCHEKLDRVDDGYVTYLAERGIDYQRPRGCGGDQCFSEVEREGTERWWPAVSPDAVDGAGDAG
jgi:hypothetical protein